MKGSDIIKTRNFSVFLLFFLIIFQSNGTVFAKSQHTLVPYEERLKSLEPSEPKTIYDYELLHERDISKFKEEILPISLVVKNGTKVPFATIYKDLNWQRPAYYSFWHSTCWRWSYVPLNMAYQQHKIYDYEGSGSWWYEIDYLVLNLSN